MVTKRIMSSNRKRYTLITTGSCQSSQGILVLILLFVMFLAGCGGTSTPLYYTAKSSIPSQAPAMQVQGQSQPQAQPQSQAPVQPQMQTQPQPQMAAQQPQPQPQMQAQMRGQPQMQMQYPASREMLQQQLMMQAARAASAGYRDYKVGPEDLLVVEVYGKEPEKREPRERRVNGLGQISLPLVGVVNVAGLTTQEIEARLRELYGSQFLRNPQITVEVKEFHNQRVAVTGAVTKPGFYDIIGPRSLLEVLAMAGGLGDKPGPEAGDVVHVIRHQNATAQSNAMKMASVQAYPPQTSTLVINIQQLVSGTDPSLNVMVKNGDVVYVPYAGTAYVAGGVRKPGNVTVKDNLTVSQAVAMAQGVDPIIGTNNVIVMRFDQQGRPIKLEANLKDISQGREADIPVQNNDTIVVVESELKKKIYVIRQLLPIPSGGYAIPTQ
jgi:polysaccharide export outer membrane protein